ncbi:glycoside hydrolase family 3 C-terminal domain-containing protein [Peterkaempfera sp. SMS 1(5)a]|uniref:glycoside hydrolase family 3 C-terminal domain-containing protein n=1 Tax=Peterkaempfera podocarpi TaxID=3232308 RepID=UPI003672A2C1
MGAALGREAGSLGVDVVLGPGANIKRSPLCGRNFEYFSEDPHISGGMGAALVSGTQSLGVGVGVKHFAVDNQETDRMRISADVDVVVRANGGVVSVAEWQHRADAVLETWPAGQAGGAAVAGLLPGLHSPSGKLTETIPLRLEDTPSHLYFPGGGGHVVHGGGRYVGYRHYDTLDVPAGTDPVRGNRVDSVRRRWSSLTSGTGPAAGGPDRGGPACTPAPKAARPGACAGCDGGTGSPWGRP